jgi:hypothetical protein
MANLKYFDSDTNTWKTLVVGAQGPQGIQGIQGETGSGPVNAIINGAFEINQRGFTSTTTNATYGFDRWQMITVDGTATYSAQTFTPGAAPIAGYEAANFARIVTSGQTAAGARTNWKQPIEDVRTFAGQTITVSFFARAGSGTPSVALDLFQGFGSGGSPSSGVSTFGGKVTLSTSWERHSLTVAVPSISGKTIGTTPNTSELQINFFVSAGTDLNARTGTLGIQSNTFDIWGVQVEAGSAATPFRRNANSLQGELAACQRYYWRAGGDTVYQTLSGETVVESTAVLAAFVNPSTMRATPTSIDFSTLMVYDGSTILTVTSATLAFSSKYKSRANLTLLSGATANRPYLVMTNNSLSGFIGFSAEL